MSKAKKKKFSVPEFKTWLEGIMQFQNEDWSPNRDQWEEIYDKIMNLKEPVNREKMGLNDPALDEINDIVYGRMMDVLKTMPQPQWQPPHTTQQNLQQPHQNLQQPHQNPQPADELANASLAELQKRYEDAQGGMSAKPAQHKLPDHVNDGGLPNDFA